MREDLLKPALTESTVKEPLYSIRAGFLVAFIGGPLAITFFSALNSMRIGRLQKDMVAYIAVCALSILIVLAGISNPQFFMLGPDDDVAQNVRYVNRLAGLLAFGLYYLMHKKNYRAEALFGNDPPSPWAPGIACIVASILVYAAVGAGYGAYYS